MDGKWWAIVLAAGEGKRVSSLTCDTAGLPVPKQFCAFRGRQSLLSSTIERAASLVAESRITAVVAAHHRRWWREDLADLPKENVIAQPRNRGTAAGLLLPLLHILRRDRAARVIVLPSDHHVRDEVRLCGAMENAIQAADRGGAGVVLLGMRPESADTEYGWIVPSAHRQDGRAVGVTRFVEKPERKLAEQLEQHGALLNSFILASGGSALMRLFVTAVPELVAALTERQGEALDRWTELVALYDSLPTMDFSRDVLEPCTGRLRVLPVADCGWIDLGTPARLVGFLRDRETENDRGMRPPAHPSLAEAGAAAIV